MEYRLYNGDNKIIMQELDIEFNCIYADCIYESLDFEWIDYCYNLLAPQGIIYIQTDYHSVAEMKIYMDNLFGKNNFLNWLVYLNEWGGNSKRFFPRKHDDILMYSKRKDYKFYPERIQIPKKTAGTAFDKKGTGLKTPCDVFYDHVSFSTISKERVKLGEKNIQWQKPLWLIERLLLPVTDENDYILDPFMGSGTSGVWSKLNNRNYIGIESDKEIYNLALARIT